MVVQLGVTATVRQFLRWQVVLTAGGYLHVCYRFYERLDLLGGKTRRLEERQPVGSDFVLMTVGEHRVKFPLTAFAVGFTYEENDVTAWQDAVKVILQDNRKAQLRIGGPIR